MDMPDRVTYSSGIQFKECSIHDGEKCILKGLNCRGPRGRLVDKSKPPSSALRCSGVNVAVRAPLPEAEDVRHVSESVQLHRRVRKKKADSDEVEKQETAPPLQCRCGATSQLNAEHISQGLTADFFDYIQGQLRSPLMHNRPVLRQDMWPTIL
ncbi:unnamed protein product, partial [Prorocentrum cordatum]